MDIMDITEMDDEDEDDDDNCDGDGGGSWWRCSGGASCRALVEDVTQQVRIVESHGKKAAILQLLHEAGLLTPGVHCRLRYADA